MSSHFGGESFGERKLSLLNDIDILTTDIKPRPSKQNETQEEKENRTREERRQKLEDFRKNHVPRFLFRAWHSGSGGGPHVTTNNTKEIVPPLFRSGKPPSFYEMKPSACDAMVNGHYCGHTTPVSGFSSWAASLHLVLSFAHNFVVRTRQDVHVAVLDTKNLDDNVYVWHCPHLKDDLGNHEYLAFGAIRGSGYKAVPFQQLVDLGLYRLFPELEQRPEGDAFGHNLRRDMFAATMLELTSNDFNTIHQLATAYDTLALPVAVALLNIRPRDLSSVLADDIKMGTLGWMRQRIGKSVTFSALASESWLMEPDMIDTERLSDFRRSFPDVRQWMNLLRHLVKDDQEAKSKAEIARGTKRKLLDDDDPVTATPKPEKKKRRTTKPYESQLEKKKKKKQTVKPSLVLVLHLKHLYEEAKRKVEVILGTKRKLQDDVAPTEDIVQPNQKKRRTIKTCHSRKGNKKQPSSTTKRGPKSTSRALRPLDMNASSLNKTKPRAIKSSDVSSCAVV